MGEKETRNLADLAGPKVGERIGAGATFILPVGAIEQHGPHLPLSVDYVIADETANAVVEKWGKELDLWLLPTLAVTKSNEHSWSPGTLWISAQTLLAVLDDIAGSLATTAAKRLVFLNAHGGNSSLLNVACRDIYLKHGFRTFLTHPSVPPDQGGGKEGDMDIHAGLQETSVMLHLRPDLVNMDLAVPNVPKKLEENTHVKFGGQVTFGWLSNDFGPDGLIGDPTGATGELGKKFFEGIVERLGEQLREITAFDFGR